MTIGVPKEIKKEEYRVGVTPSGVQDLKKEGHRVLIEGKAGEGSGFSDKDYENAGAEIVDKETLFRKADLVVKVKEPLPSEYPLPRENLVIFTYLHLAQNHELTELLLKKRVIALGYETLQKDGKLPLLSPMSEIAGRMAPIVGSYYLQKRFGGEGILSTGVAGVRPAKTLILGAGVVGTNSARVSLGLSMDVVVLNRGLEKLQRIDELFMGNVRTAPLNSSTIQNEIKDADIIIGAILIPGGKPPVLITREMLKSMKKGAVIIDVSIDQGGCIETSEPTTHEKPVYEVEGILHYCVANMPGIFPRTSTLALTNATLPYIKILSRKGIERAIREDPEIKSAINIYKSKILHKTLAESLSRQSP